jgi:flagellar hook-associated protein 1 FlgK
MPSTFLGLETALRGLTADQRSIDTTGHNIANAQTPGYSRQVAELQAAPALPMYPKGELGTGVTVVQYQRIRDTFIDMQLRAQTMRQGSYSAQQSGLSQIDQSLAEPSDNGLSSLLSKYWASWQNVANSPSDLATRTAMIESASSLANGINTLANQLTTIQAQTSQNETLTLGQVNSIGGQIAALNQSIQAAELAGAQPNDLLDQRDNLIDQLSSLGNTTVSQSAGAAGQLGSIDVTFGGATLVTANAAGTLTQPLPSVTSGQLAGMDAVIAAIGTSGSGGYLDELNTLAAGIAGATNTQLAAGKDLNGNAGTALFTVASGSEASTIAVNSAVASSPGLIAASTNGDPGDGSNALAVAGLQQSALIGGASIDTAYSQLVTQIGADSQQAQTNLDNANSLVQSLTNRRQSVSGVSLDEEMTNLLAFQRGYQACARVMSAMDSMIDTLVNHTGTVGL